MNSGNRDDDALFAEAMSDVKPLRHNLAAQKPPRTPLPSVPSAPEESDSEFGEELTYIRPGIQRTTLQKLRRGQFPVEAIFDLHGLHSSDASEKLQQFIRQSQMSGRRAVRIVHGKGYGSVGRQPVLKVMVNQVLRQLHTVLAFCSAKERDGGTGAVDVLLRRGQTPNS
jgi:DNA-nicking Smr family endonuclease